MSSKYPTYIYKTAPYPLYIEIFQDCFYVLGLCSRYIREKRSRSTESEIIFSFLRVGKKGKKKRNLFSYRDITFEYEAIKEYQF